MGSIAEANDAEFLQWIHDRLELVHGENHNYDYMHKLRTIISDVVKAETMLAAYRTAQEATLGHE